MNPSFKETSSHVLEWAKEKGLTLPQNHLAQMAKVTEEIGELNGAILKGKRTEEIDAFGDILVTLVILAEQRGVDLEGAFGMAHQVIKYRKGKMVNGSFIKNEEQ